MIGNVSNATKTASAGANSSLDKDMFLQLLVAQMKFQDPMKPMDSAQWTAQMAQFTQVEQLENLNQAQSDATAYQRLVLSTSLVGKEVKGEIPGVGGQVIPVSGIVDRVRFGGGGAVLVINGTELPLDSVTEVQPAKT